MFYGDLLAVAEKEITSSNFCCLVDVAVMLYEQEQDRKSLTKRKKKKKTLEDSDKMSFFHVFPRKTRTSSVKKSLVSRSNTQQNLHEITTDSDTTNPKKPPFSFSSMFLGDYKTKAESEKTNSRNPNSKIAAESEKTVKRNPRNPSSESSNSSCLTESKSRKRRAVQEKNPSGGSRCKKPKVEAFSWIGRETPERLSDLMRDMNGTNLNLIFERSLFKTDVNPKESRLSMPFNELIKKDFLKPVESRIIEEDIKNDKKIGVGAILIDQRNVKWGVMLKRWEMKKDSGNGSWNYALTCGWNDIVEANGLKLDDRISIWSFRLGGLLCFALATPPPSVALCL